MKNLLKMKRIIIDFEFTWLDNSFVKDNEIISMSYADIDTKESKVFYFASKKKNTITSFLKNGITLEEQKGQPLFSKELFDSIIDVENSEFYGFCIGTDKKMLEKYGISFDYTGDIQSMLRKTKYEEQMALEWRAFETCCYIVLGEIFDKEHKWTYEVDKLIELFNKAMEYKEDRLLRYVPYGWFAWMLIKDFAKEYPKKALSYAQEGDYKEAIEFHLKELGLL